MKLLDEQDRRRYQETEWLVSQHFLELVPTSSCLGHGRALIVGIVLDRVVEGLQITLVEPFEKPITQEMLHGVI